jgi:L-seryl-tRNA(Ser) seleniumtransferase
MPDYRVIPSIDELRQRPAISALEARYGSQAIVSALRQAADSARAAIANGRVTGSAGPDAAAQIERDAIARLHDLFEGSLRRVINATGVILHTNLGRAPLAESALRRLYDVARSYSSLEYDVEAGTRGRRDIHAERLLCELTGAAAAVVVNNNAAATLLVLAALASGREVVVSRGELVEIGGGFRVPDVLRQSGAVLREVGTTNRTRAADYAAAVTDRTALILRVHPSNFTIEGFTERPSLDELVAVGRRLNVPVAEDLGSGLLAQAFASAATHPLATSEPTVQATIASGVDVCCFSGDKLLGGPQAGIIVGRKTLVDGVRKHPLMRALRVDKLTYAALEATLAEYAAGRASILPVHQMLTASADSLRARADAFARAVSAVVGFRADVVSGTSAVGGGSAPGVELRTFLVAIDRDHVGAPALDARLRALSPPVITRIVNDRVVVDLRTVTPAEQEELVTLLASVG